MSLSASPTSLAFAARTVASTSPAQDVTITNTGTASATLGTIATTGDYAQTKTCATTLAAGASCTVSVTFTPDRDGHPHRHPERGQQRPERAAERGPDRHRRLGAVTNLAQGRSTTETSHSQTYGSGNVVDGNSSTYWESANNAFPQSVTVDLGSS